MATEILLLSRISVIISRTEYRLVSNSITRRRFDWFDTTIIMVYLRTDYCWIKYLRCISKRASTWWGLLVSGPWISPDTRSSEGRAWASPRRNPCPARLVLSAWTRLVHYRTVTVADWLVCPLSATDAVVPPSIRSSWNLINNNNNNIISILSQFSRYCVLCNYSQSYCS